jgi:ABC-type transporter Mla subunit MlaD
MSQQKQVTLDQLITAVTDAVVQQVNTVLGELESKINTLSKRLDNQGSEIEALRKEMKTITADIAAQYVKQAIEAAIEASAKGLSSQVSVATEPVVARISQLEGRMTKMEKLLESAGDNIRQAVESILSQAADTFRDSVKDVTSITQQVEQLRDSMSKLSTRVDGFKTAIEQLSKQIASTPSRDSVDAIAKKVDGLASEVAAQKVRLDRMEKLLERIARDVEKTPVSEEDEEGDSDIRVK